MATEFSEQDIAAAFAQEMSKATEPKTEPIVEEIKVSEDKPKKENKLFSKLKKKQNNKDDGNSEGPKKKLNIGIIIGSIAAILIIAAAVYFVPKIIGKASLEGVTVYGERTIDEENVIALGDGTLIVFDSDVAKSAITGDRKNVVVLTEDGELYITDKKQSKKTLITDEAQNDYLSVNNGGIMYRSSDKKNSIHIFNFKGSTDVELISKDKYVSGIRADNRASFAYLDNKGNIYVLKDGNTEAEKIASENEDKNYVSVNWVSDDGDTVIWTTRPKDGGDSVVHIANKGNEETVKCKPSGSGYDGTTVTFNRDQKTALIERGNNVIVYHPGKEPQKVSFNDSVGLFYAAGDHFNESEGIVKEFYAAVSNDGLLDLYWFNDKGDKEKVKKGLDGYGISSNKFFYIEEEDLYVADLKGSELKNEERIAKDVNVLFTSSGDGQYVYFLKDYEDYEGDFYVYKCGKKDPIKIASNIGYNETYISGNEVIYFEEVEEIGNTYQYVGELKKYTYGRDSVKILSDAIEYAVTDNNRFDWDFSNLIIQKYESTDKNGNIEFSYYHYNGREAKAIKKNITIDNDYNPSEKKAKEKDSSPEAKAVETKAAATEAAKATVEVKAN